MTGPDGSCPSALTACGPWLSTMLCAYSSLACVGVFLFLIDRVAKQLRPVGILPLVGAEAPGSSCTSTPRPLTARRRHPQVP